MVKVIHGDIFDSPEENYLVNPVNTVGVMGKGLAKEFKERFPEECKSYEKYYMDARPGDIIHHTGDRVIHAATKQHWKYPSELSWVESCLKRLRTYAEQASVNVSLPLLGCGEGKLNEIEVRQLIDDILGPSHIKFTLYVKSN